MKEVKLQEHSKERVRKLNYKQPSFAVFLPSSSSFVVVAVVVWLEQNKLTIPFAALGCESKGKWSLIIMIRKMNCKVLSLINVPCCICWRLARWEARKSFPSLLPHTPTHKHTHNSSKLFIKSRKKHHHLMCHLHPLLHLLIIIIKRLFCVSQFHCH